jgi:Flp pilus assembly secretin CpaC
LQGAFRLPAARLGRAHSARALAIPSALLSSLCVNVDELKGIAPMSVRRQPIYGVIAAAALAAALAPSALAAEPFKVALDQTVSMSLSHPAASVALGNATVADVTVSDANTLLITGKAFGTTNLLVLDRNGQTILKTQLVVSSDNVGQLTIYRGSGTNTYSCIEKCRPAPVVGDAADFYSNTMGTIQSKAATAAGTKQ